MLIKSPIGMAVSPYIDIIDRCAKIMFRAANEVGSRRRRDRGSRAAPATAAEAKSPWAQFKVIDGGVS